jgi:hypothetical protein
MLVESIFSHDGRNKNLLNKHEAILAFGIFGTTRAKKDYHKRSCN